MAREKRLSAALVMVGSVQVQLADGTAGAPALAFKNDTATGLYSIAANVLGIATNGTERWRVTNGAAFLGTPASNLSVIGLNTSDASDTASLALVAGSSASTGRGGIVQLYGNEHGSRPGNLEYYAGNVTGGGHRFYTGAAVERMRLNDSGALLVGATSPAGISKSLTAAYTAVSGDSGSSISVAAISQSNAVDSAFSGTVSSLQALLTRTITTSLTDTGRLNSISPLLQFSVAAGQTLTNTNSEGAASVNIQTPTLSGTGTLAYTHLSGVNIEASSLATGTNKYGIKIGAQSGATNNYAIGIGASLPSGSWALASSSSDTSYLAGSLRVATTGAIAANDRLAVRFSDSTGGGSGKVAIAGEMLSTDSATGVSAGTYAGLYGVLNRTTTANISDTGILNAIQTATTFTPSASTTYTNANSSGVSGLRIGAVSNAGAGSLAITHYQGIHVVGSSVNTGTNKYGVRVDDQSGATNNYAIKTGTGVVDLGDDLKLTVAGKGLYVKEGSNATMGTATLTAGAATVNTTKVTANSRIFLTSQSDGGTPGFLRVSARTASTSFTITSSSGTDTSTVAWMIVEPA